MKPEPFGFSWSAKTPGQRDALRAFDAHDLLFLLGPAGTGKTFAALALALREVYEGRKKKVVFARPLVEAGEKLGYLPGELSEKVAPYLGPLHDNLARMAYKVPKDVLDVRTLAYMRGLTFSDATVVVSEAQNLTRAQLKLALTRMGANCKMIVEGDPDQADVPGRDFEAVVGALEDVPGVAVVDFDGRFSCRHPLVAKVLERL